MTQITEAQRLAAWHKKAWYSVKIAWDTAAELRRLEAANAELLEALEKISAIELQMYGPDWEEINIAKEIAAAAIKKHGGAA